MNCRSLRTLVLAVKKEHYSRCISTRVHYTMLLIVPYVNVFRIMFLSKSQLSRNIIYCLKNELKNCLTASKIPNKVTVVSENAHAKTYVFWSHRVPFDHSLLFLAVHALSSGSGLLLVWSAHGSYHPRRKGPNTVYIPVRMKNRLLVSMYRSSMNNKGKVTPARIVLATCKMLWIFRYHGFRWLSTPSAYHEFC